MLHYATELNGQSVLFDAFVQSVLKWYFCGLSIADAMVN